VSALVTRCPACGTAFRVLPGQLSARVGKVRCGKCQSVFDGVANLLETTTTPTARDSWEGSPLFAFFLLGEKARSCKRSILTDADSVVHKPVPRGGVRCAHLPRAGLPGTFGAKESTIRRRGQLRRRGTNGSPFRGHGRFRSIHPCLLKQGDGQRVGPQTPETIPTAARRPPVSTGYPSMVSG
jgi:predicted Zn finger-like uncharacterized protein